MLPGDWDFKESITLLSPDGQANIIFSSEPVSSDFDSTRYAQIQGELLYEEFPEYIEQAFDPVVFGGIEGWERRFEWKPADRDRVTQIQRYAVAAQRGYTATATVPAQSFSIHGELLQTLLAELWLTPSTAEETP
jgi:hypothetical protein